MCFIKVNLFTKKNIFKDLRYFRKSTAEPDSQCTSFPGGMILRYGGVQFKILSSSTDSDQVTAEINCHVFKLIFESLWPANTSIRELGESGQERRGLSWPIRGQHLKLSTKRPMTVSIRKLILSRLLPLFWKRKKYKRDYHSYIC